MSLLRIQPKQRIACAIDGPFDEVQNGYQMAEALKEAERCLQCRHEPCVKGCPANLPIPQFIKAIKDGTLDEAKSLIDSRTNLSRICSRVCFYENQCEGSCVRGIKGEPIAIGLLERFVSDGQARLEASFPAVVRKEKIAIIGSGPSGLACAKDLADGGFQVEIFEASELGGGVLRYGIPGYRLPSNVVEEEIQSVLNKGVLIHYRTMVGKDLPFSNLINQFDAIYVATGVGTSYKLNIEGDDLGEVLSANDFLRYIQDDRSHAKADIQKLVKDRRVRIIGGGNVAMDAARSAIRLKAKNVKIIYRRGMEDLPARPEEIHEALSERVQFLPLLSPVKIGANDDGHVSYMICEINDLSEPKDDGRRLFVSTGKKVRIKADLVIEAIGGGGAMWLLDNEYDIGVTKQGYINVGLHHATSHEKVFAGGDVVSGALTVVHAMRSGREAAIAIETYCNSKLND